MSGRGWFQLTLGAIALGSFMACSDGPSGPSQTAPTAETLPATGITTSQGVLNGRVNPNGTATTWDIEIGESAALGQSCLFNQRGTLSGDTPQSVQCTVDGLPPGATIHYRVIAENAAGQAKGQTLTFTTDATSPTVETLPAENVEADRADLLGSVEPNGLVTTYWFEAGFTPDLGQEFARRETPSATGKFTATQTISIQSSGSVTVYYRIVAENDLGRSYGAVRSFTTPAS